MEGNFIIVSQLGVSYDCIEFKTGFVPVVVSPLWESVRWGMLMKWNYAVVTASFMLE
jgi:hypothetical protein